MFLVVQTRLRLLPSNLQFRVNFVYNNLIYGLISRISEIIGHDKKWEDLISEHFFHPLGMTKSTFATRVDFERPDLAHGYIQPDMAGKYNRVSSELSRRWADMCGSGAVLSSVTDMAKWMAFHLSRGKSHLGNQIMDSSLIDQLHTARYLASSLNYLNTKIPEFPVTVQGTKYALGLRVGHYRGYDMVTHTGSTFGYASMMTLLPTENIGVITLMNGDDPKYKHRAAIQYYLLDHVLGLQPWINSTTICSYPRPWLSEVSQRTYRPKQTDQKLQYPVAQYQGLYADEAFGNLVVQYNATLQSLVASYGWGDWELYLWNSTNSTAEQDERFYGKGLGPGFPPDMKPFYFISHPKSTDTFIGLKAPAFESKRPPIFCKQEHIKLCEEIKAQVYPIQTQMEACVPVNGAESLYHGILVYASSVILLILVNFQIYQNTT